MNRFFLVPIIALKNGAPIYTNATYATDDGAFVNKQEIEQGMKAAGFDSAIITNVIEISEEDFADYIRIK